MDYEPGAPGVGDPYFPLYGNGGYQVNHYDLSVRYDPATDELRVAQRGVRHLRRVAVGRT
jgi:hypothetical protein